MTAVIPLRFSVVESALRNEAFDHHPLPSFCLNASGQVLLINRAGSRFLGPDAKHIIGRNLADFLALSNGRTIDRRWRQLWARLQEHRSLSFNVTLSLVGADRFQSHINATLFRADEEPLALVTMGRVDADGASRLTAARAAVLGDGAAEGTVLLAPDRRVLISQGRLLPLIGVSSAGAVGVPFEYLVDEATEQEFLSAFNRLVQLPVRSTLAIQGRARAHQGSAPRSRLSLTLVNLLKLPRVGAVLVRVRQQDDSLAPEAIQPDSDISRQRQINERLAWYDSLTGLPNRNMVRETLRDAMASAAARKSRLAVLLIDLDRFKDINDTMGHLVGDAMLRSVVEALRASINTQASLSRLGGDEFLVVFEDFPHRHDVAELGERIVKALYRSDFLPNVVTQMSASIGVALYPEHGREVGGLLKNADAAMYQAKRDGRNQVSFFNPIRYERAAREVRMGIELMKAIQAGKAQFFLEYQPQVDISSGKVVGLEALIRWRHPEHGILTPDRFIDAAESSGLSDRITNWVLHECCEQILRWRAIRPGFDVPISINVAGSELGSNSLPLIVKAALNQHQIEPSMVVLEITERTLVKDGEANNDVIAELNALGVGLILDDFGTGYSTLSYLRRMPIRAIKIDRSFVKNLPQDLDSRALVTAMLSLAQHFRLAVVAEGVETQAQARYLRQQGCSFAQGYLYSRPLLPERISEQLKTANGPAPRNTYTGKTQEQISSPS